MEETNDPCRRSAGVAAGANDESVPARPVGRAGCNGNSGTRAARTAWPKAARWLRSAKFLTGSLKNGRPSPKPGIAGLS